MMSVFILTLVYQSFIETLRLDFSFSRVLSLIFVLSLFTGMFNSLKVKTNITLNKPFFMTLVIDSLKALKVFSIPVEMSELFKKGYYGVFLTLTFLIIINNLSNKNLNRAIAYNGSLAMFCSGADMLQHFRFTIPAALYEYIPVFFLILNLAIYVSRSNPEALQRIGYKD